MNTNKTLLLIVQTALLLALTLVFQIYVRMLFPQGALINTLVVGSLVNLCLCVAAGTVGWRGSVVISVIAPVVALLMAQIIFLPQVLFVAAGNVTICLIYEFVGRKQTAGIRPWIAVGASSVGKFIVLYVLMVVLFVGIMMPGLPQKQRDTISLMFSWPQIITALVGGIVAVPVISAVHRALRYPQTGGVKADG